MAGRLVTNGSRGLEFVFATDRGFLFHRLNWARYAANMLSPLQ
jgi:hypothetical protein